MSAVHTIFIKLTKLTTTFIEKQLFLSAWHWVRHYTTMGILWLPTQEHLVWCVICQQRAPSPVRCLSCVGNTSCEDSCPERLAPCWTVRVQCRHTERCWCPYCIYDWTCAKCYLCSHCCIYFILYDCNAMFGFRSKGKYNFFTDQTPFVELIDPVSLRLHAFM